MERSILTVIGQQHVCIPLCLPRVGLGTRLLGDLLQRQDLFNDFMHVDIERLVLVIGSDALTEVGQSFSEPILCKFCEGERKSLQRIGIRKHGQGLPRQQSHGRSARRELQQTQLETGNLESRRQEHRSGIGSFCIFDLARLGKLSTEQKVRQCNAWQVSDCLLQEPHGRLRITRSAGVYCPLNDER